jgi:hypothetical protein
LSAGRAPTPAPVDRISFLIHVNPDLNLPGRFGGRVFFCQTAGCIAAASDVKAAYMNVVGT